MLLLLDIIRVYDMLIKEHLIFYTRGTSMRDDTKTVAGAFLIGGLIGAAIALLYAPKSGRETRKHISKTARRIKNDAVDLIEDTIDDVHDFASDLKDKTEDIIEHGRNLTDKAKKEIISALEQGQSTLEKQRKRLKEALGL